MATAAVVTVDFSKFENEKHKLPDSVIGPLTDEATKIVGRALLLKGEPPGHQLPLRMILYFGWDFGLSDLSIRELHAFLLQMGIIADFYDTEALRKYRDRLRKFIRANPQDHWLSRPNENRRRNRATKRRSETRFENSGW